MPHTVKPIPEGFHTLTPYLIVNDGAKAIQFYKDAFGASVVSRNAMPDGKIMHAQLKIGDSMLMLSDEFPEQGCPTKAPLSLKGTTAMVNIYSKDVDTLFAKAEKAGAKVLMPLADMFWGDRYGQLQDPFGHIWSIASHIKDVTEEEINEAAADCFSSKKD